MAELVNVKVTVEGGKPAIDQLTQIQTLITNINKNPVTVKVDPKKIDQTTASVKKYTKETKEATKQNNLLGDSFERIVAKMAVWQLLGNAIATVIRSFREAVATMKEVDTQLTNIQKVSNLSAEEIKKIGDNSYEAASKFGVAAEEYLKAVYEFQKAGLGESAEQMAQLATKTMLVGDTTADVADKFIIAVNAAWNLEGAMDALSKVVDQADYVNNNYATTLEKLADSMPIVASTAANMNMSYEETLALLAAINSKTQETGRKTATAVRSFLIAISGQVGEFVDDVGETYEVTTENIEALTDALAKYGNAAVQNAIKTGEIINPMEALNSLAQAYKDGLLSDIELQNILINVAGKMRYNSLVTIVRDLASETSTYRDILQKLPSAIGTADAEVETMLTSWEAKTNILKNTWADFIQKTVQSGFAKAMLDIANAVLKFSGSLGNLIPLIATVTLKIKLSTAATKQKEMARLADIAAAELQRAAELKNATAQDKEAASTARATAEIENQKAARLSAASSAAGWVGIVVAAISIGVMAWQNYERAQEEARQKAVEAAESTQTQIDALKELKKQYTDVMDSTEDEGERNEQLSSWKSTLIEQYGLERDALKDVNKERQTGIDLLNEEIAKQSDAWMADEKNAKAYQKAVEEMTRSFTHKGSVEWASQFADPFAAILQRGGFSVTRTPTTAPSGYTGETVSFAYEAKNAQEAVAKLKPVLAELHAEINKGKKFTAEETRAIQELETAYNNAQKRIDTYNSVFTKGNQILAERIFSENASRAAQVNSIETFNDYVVGLRNEAGANEALADALESLANDAFPQFVQANIDAANALFDTEGKLTDAGKAALDADSKFAALVKQIINTRAEAAATSYSNLISELNKTGDAALTNAAKLALFKGLFEEATGRTMSTTEERYYSGYVGGENKSVDNTKRIATSAKTLLDRLQAEAQSLAAYVPSTANPSTTSPDGKTGNQHKEKTPDEIELERRKNIVTTLKAELALMEAQGKPLSERETKMRSIQSALHDQAEQERKINGITAESLSLSKEWWDYENKIADEKQKEADEAEKAAEEERKRKEEEKKQEAEEARQRYEDRKSAVESDLDYEKSVLSHMEAQGDPLDQQIAQRRKIITLTRELADITEDRIEEEKLLTEALKDEAAIQELITEEQKKRYKSLTDDAITALNEQEKARLAPLQSQLEILKAQKDAVEDAREEEEKRLAVEKARIALENAQRERTIRQYNAATGQWEWVADAKAVADAKESLAKAENDLSDFYRDRSIKALEKNISSIQHTYDVLRDSINSFADEIQNGTASMASALQYLIQSIRGSDLTPAQQASIGGTVNAISSALSSAGQQVILDQMKANSAAWHTADAETKKALSDQNLALGAAQGWHRTNGTWYDSNGNQVYDSGGILHGVGGIKATKQDEMVMPPWITSAMLRAESTGAFDALLNHLGIVTAAANSIAGFGGATTKNSIGSQHNGDVFEIGGIQISEAQARGMSVYDFAQTARTLALHRGA